MEVTRADLHKQNNTIYETMEISKSIPYME